MTGENGDASDENPLDLSVGDANDEYVEPVEVGDFFHDISSMSLSQYLLI